MSGLRMVETTNDQGNSVGSERGAEKDDMIIG